MSTVNIIVKSKFSNKCFLTTATPGVPGDPGYMQLIFMRYRDGRRRRLHAPTIEMVPKGNDMVFNLGAVQVNLRKGTIKVSHCNPI